MSNEDIFAAIEEMTPEQIEDVHRSLSFQVFPETHWTIKTKSKGFQPFKLLPAQLIMDIEYEKQMESRGFVRLNILKCRQVACTSFVTRKALKFCMHNEAVTALTIAHETGLPGQWLRECRRNFDETPDIFKPGIESGQHGRLSFDNGSSYYIGSAQGGFPGMGDTVHFRHHSEMGRWDKPPISKDPDEVLIPLDPATPKGSDRFGTVQIYESTGVMKGDWWSRKWESGKDKQDEYANIMLPWFMVDTYRRDDLTKDILEYSTYEQWTIKEAFKYGIDLTRAQIAWYRNMLRQKPWSGNEPQFKAEYPADENEAFMSPGETVYSPEQVTNARDTEREPIWRGNLLGTSVPEKSNFRDNGESGDTWIWEWPDKNYHYVLGADCMWGKSNEADWDVLYVECLETGRLVAKMRDRYQMPEWGWKIAAMGHKYNICPVAPERNKNAGADADGVMATLRGAVSNWAYPNIWIDSDEVKFRGYRPEGYGWNTTGPSKQKLISFSQEQTLQKEFDWCDSQVVDEMATIITRDDHSRGAPKGSKDDCWMARLITAMVAHRVRGYTTLYEKPTEKRMELNSLEYRLELQLKEEDIDGDGEYGATEG